MVIFIILVALIAFAIQAVNSVVDNNNKKNEIDSLEREIAELKKIKDDRILLQAEIYRLRKENLNLMKRF